MHKFLKHTRSHRDDLVRHYLVSGASGVRNCNTHDPFSDALDSCDLNPAHERISPCEPRPRGRVRDFFSANSCYVGENNKGNNLGCDRLVIKCM